MDFTGKKQDLSLHSQYAPASVKGFMHRRREKHQNVNSGSHLVNSR